MSAIIPSAFSDTLLKPESSSCTPTIDLDTSSVEVPLEKTSNPTLQPPNLKSQLLDLEVIDEWNQYIGSDLALFRSLPPLIHSKNDLSLLLNILHKNRRFIGKNLFHATFSIADLLIHIKHKFNDYIEEIELVGGAVNSVISKDYLCTVLQKLNIENGSEFLSDEYMETHFGKSNDIDFRFYLKQGACQCYIKNRQTGLKIQEEIRRSICMYLAKKYTSAEEPSIKDCMFVWENAIVKKHRNDGDGIAIYGLQTPKTRIEIVFFEKEQPKREYLFTMDDLRVPLSYILSNNYQRHTFFQSKHSNLTALLAKMLDNVDLLEISSMNIFGFPLWLTKLVKGMSSPATTEDQNLLARYISQLKTADLPKGYAASEKLTDEDAKIPSLIAFHHFCCVENHLSDSPRQAFILGFLLLMHLEHYFEKNVLTESWKLIKNNIEHFHPNSTENISVYDRCFSNELLTYTQIYSWFSLTSWMHVFTNECNAIVLNHTKKPHLQVTFKKASLLFPIIEPPKARTMTLIRKFLLINQSSLLINWDLEISLNANFIKYLHPLAETLDDSLIDPLFSFEVFALIQHSGLADVRTQLLDLFPHAVLIAGDSILSVIKHIFKEMALINSFEKIIKWTGSKDKADNLLLDKMQKYCLKEYACSQDPFFKTYAINKIKQITHSTTFSGQNFCRTIFKFIIENNCALAIEILPQLKLNLINFIKFYFSIFDFYNQLVDKESLKENFLKLTLFFCDSITEVENIPRSLKNLCKKILNKIIDLSLSTSNTALNQSLVNAIHKYCCSLNTKKIADNNQLEKLFPSIALFQEKLLNVNEIESLKKLLFIFHEKHLINGEAIWLKYCKILADIDPRMAFQFFKEGSDQEILHTKDKLVDAFIYITGKTSDALSNATLQYILSFGLNEAQKENVMSHYQDLNISDLQALMTENPLRLAAIRKGINSIISFGLSHRQYESFFAILNEYASQEKFDLLLEFFYSNLDFFLCNHFPESPNKYMTIISGKILNYLDDLLLKNQHLSMQNIELILKIISSDVSQEESQLPIQRDILTKTFLLMESLWTNNVILPKSLCEFIKNSHSNIFKILSNQSTRCLIVLNQFNIDFPLEDRTQTMIYELIGNQLNDSEQFANKMHLLLKNCLKCQRLSTSNEGFLPLAKNLISYFQTTNYDFSCFWLDQILIFSEFSEEISVVLKEFIEFTIDKGKCLMTLKFLKQLHKVKGPVNKTQLLEKYFNSLLSHEDKDAMIAFLKKEANSLKVICTENLSNKELQLETFLYSFLCDFLKVRRNEINQVFELLKRFCFNNGSFLFDAVSYALAKPDKNSFKGFKLFLEILESVEPELLNLEHTYACVKYLSVLKENYQVKRLIDKKELFWRIFPPSEPVNCIAALNLCSDYLLSNKNETLDARISQFEELLSYYKTHFGDLNCNETFRCFYRTLLSLQIKDLEKHLVGFCENLNTVIKHTSRHQGLTEILKLSNIIGSTVDNLSNQHQQEFLCNRQKIIVSEINDHFQSKHTKLIEQLNLLLDWWLSQKDLLEDSIPCVLLNCFRQPISYELLKKATEVFLNCKEIPENSILKTIGIGLLSSCATADEESMRQFAYDVMTHPSHTFLSEQDRGKLMDIYLYCELCTKHTSNIKITAALREEKIQKFHDNFILTSPIKTLRSAVKGSRHLESIKTTINHIVHRVIVDCDCSLEELNNQVFKLRETIRNKIKNQSLGQQESNPLADPLLEWYYFFILSMGDICNTYQEIKFYFDRLYEFISIHLNNLIQYNMSIEFLMQLSLNSIVLLAGAEEYQKFLNFCVEKLSTVTNESDIINQGKYYFNLLCHQKDDKELHGKLNIEQRSNLLYTLTNSVCIMQIPHLTDRMLGLLKNVTNDFSTILILECINLINLTKKNSKKPINTPTRRKKASGIK